MATLTLTANQTGRTITLLNTASSTGYFLIADGTDWGNAEYQTTYGGPVGRRGMRPAYSIPQNRTIVHKFRARGGGAKDGLAILLQSAYQVADDVRRFGGSLLWQSSGQTYRQTFEVLTLQHDIDWTGNNAENLLRAEFTITYTTAPFADGDPMDTVDDFSVDTIGLGYWTQDGAGAATISGGFFHPTTSTALTRFRHSLKGYRIGDVEVTMKFTTSASVGGTLLWGVTARCAVDGTDTMISAEVAATAANVIRIRKYVAGSATDLATAAFTPAALTTYWVRLRLEGLKWTAEVYTSAPTPVATAAASAVYTATADEASRFATGHTGLRIVGVSSDLVDEWSSKPYTYKLLNTPEHVALVGAVPGDVAASADLEVTPLGGSASPVLGMFGVLERPQANNFCWNGDFESATIGTDGWVATAVSGVIGAATSVARDTTAARVKYGSGAMQIVCPATSDTGASFLIRRRFRRGCTYVMMAWASSAAGTTQARCKLGVSGDLATPAGGIALAATSKLFSVIWTPTADRDFAYAAFGITAATGTTFSIDGVVVVELPTVVALTANTSSGTTTLPVYNTPTDGTQTLPFLALIDQELFRVTAASGTSWTVDPGVEGSTQTTHLSGAQVAVLPLPRRQLEGAGAWEPMDIIEAESYVPSLSSITGSAVLTTSTDYRGGNGLAWSGMTPGANNYFVWMVDPSLVVPDDYSLGEVDVEVWLRYAAGASAITSLKVNASCIPDGGTAKGSERLTREWGNAGKLLSLPSGGAFRFSRIGTVPMISDKSNALRWQFKLSLIVGVAGTIDLDHLIFVAVRNRLASPTAKANDVATSGGSFPSLIPYDASWGSTSAMTKTLRADGSGLVNEIGKPSFPDHGLGRVLELPAGDCDLILKSSNLVPDDPTSDNTVEMAAGAPSYAESIHLPVTPRFALIRGS